MGWVGAFCFFIRQCLTPHFVWLGILFWRLRRRTHVIDHPPTNTPLYLWYGRFSSSSSPPLSLRIFLISHQWTQDSQNILKGNECFITRYPEKCIVNVGFGWKIFARAPSMSMVINIFDDIVGNCRHNINKSSSNRESQGELEWSLKADAWASISITSRCVLVRHVSPCKSL